MSKVFTLEGEVDKIIEYIIEGKTFRQIAEIYNVALGTVHNYISLDEHSARVRMAQEIAADTYADKAEEVLMTAKGTLPEIQRARELAQHYRWKASKTRPKKYGDRLELDGEVKTNVTPEALSAIADKINSNAGTR